MHKRMFNSLHLKYVNLSKFPLCPGSTSSVQTILQGSFPSYLVVLVSIVSTCQTRSLASAARSSLRPKTSTNCGNILTGLTFCAMVGNTNLIEAGMLGRSGVEAKPSPNP